MGGFMEKLEEEKEWLFDEMAGERKKTNVAALNKKKLSKYELDELFASE